MNTNGYKAILLSLYACFAFGITHAQPSFSIAGVQCVLPNIIYQYDLKATGKENNKLKICVENGVLVGSSDLCIEAATVPYIRVQWHEGQTAGKITVSGADGSAQLGVTIAAPFHPGTIQTPDKQTIGFSKSAPTLTCTVATGANCSPSFSYQWELSTDKLQWTAIKGATTSNLSLRNRLERTTFFRRKAIEIKSKTTGYSNEITVFVNAEKKSQ